MARVANEIDFDGMGLYYEVPNVVGTAGTTPTDLDTYLQAGVAMDDNMTPRDSSRAAVISPKMQASLVNGLKGLFQSSEKIADQYERGTMGLAGGFKFSMDQNCHVHQVGPLGGSPVTNQPGQTGSSLNVTGFTAAACRATAASTHRVAS